MKGIGKPAVAKAAAHSVRPSARGGLLAAAWAGTAGEPRSGESTTPL